MAEAPETIDIFLARPGDIVIYGGYSSSSQLSPHTRMEEWAEAAVPAHRKKGHTQRMAHTPHDPERVIEKAFIVRFFADGGFRVEGPFPPRQVQRLIDTNECQVWLRDLALFAIWGREPIANVSELFMLVPEINEIASRLAHKRYQPLKANHYRAQHGRHWQDEKGQTL